MSLQGSEIHRNVVTSTSGGSLVSVESVDPFHQNVDHGTILRLEACDLEDNSVPHILMAFSNADSDDLEVQIYSDLAREVHNVRSNTTSVGTLPLTVGVDGSQDINSTSPWFSNAQQVRSYDSMVPQSPTQTGCTSVSVNSRLSTPQNAPSLHIVCPGEATDQV